MSALDNLIELKRRLEIYHWDVEVWTNVSMTVRRNPLNQTITKFRGVEYPPGRLVVVEFNSLRPTENKYTIYKDEEGNDTISEEFIIPFPTTKSGRMTYDDNLTTLFKFITDFLNPSLNAYHVIGASMAVSSPEAEEQKLLTEIIDQMHLRLKKLEALCDVAWGCDEQTPVDALISSTRGATCALSVI